jgi:hypothetical protein
MLEHFFFLSADIHRSPHPRPLDGPRGCFDVYGQNHWNRKMNIRTGEDAMKERTEKGFNLIVRIDLKLLK